MQLAAAGAPPGEVPGAEASCISRLSLESRYLSVASRIVELMLKVEGL